MYRVACDNGKSFLFSFSRRVVSKMSSFLAESFLLKHKEHSNVLNI